VENIEKFTLANLKRFLGEIFKPKLKPKMADPTQPNLSQKNLTRTHHQ